LAVVISDWNLSENGSKHLRKDFICNATFISTELRNLKPVLPASPENGGRLSLELEILVLLNAPIILWMLHSWRENISKDRSGKT
jgi:hypothetical protein